MKRKKSRKKLESRKKERNYDKHHIGIAKVADLTY